MDTTEARIFREAHAAALTRYGKMSKAQLVREDTELLAEQGIERFAGPASKDEVLADVMRHRGYTIEKLNETIHVLCHEPGTVGSTACAWCVCQTTWTNADGYLMQCTLPPGHEGMCQCGQSFYAPGSGAKVDAVRA